MMMWLACILGAFLSGSIPFGVLIGKVLGVDIRAHGSRNIGATNVSRVLGKKLGVLCFVLDFLKGAGPVALAGIWSDVLGREPAELTWSQMWLWMAVALAAVMGHIFSPFIGFRGGKGVATGFGAALAMWPLLTLPALGALVVWYVTVRVAKYVSLASMLAVSSIPISYLLSVIPHDAQDQPIAHTINRIVHASPPLLCTVALAGLVIWKHRANIGRLRRGEEPQVDASARRGDL